MARLNICACLEPVEDVGEEYCRACRGLAAETADSARPDDCADGASTVADKEETCSTDSVASSGFAEDGANRGVCPDPTCGAELGADTTRCVFCGLELSPTVRLAFPNGETTVDAFPVVLGRDPAASPLAELCASHDNISRAHAELQLIDGRVHVRDGTSSRPASTNGTFLNGQRVGPEAVPIHPGDTLRLASNVRIDVRDG